MVSLSTNTALIELYDRVQSEAPNSISYSHTPSTWDIAAETSLGRLFCPRAVLCWKSLSLSTGVPIASVRHVIRISSMWCNSVTSRSTSDRCGSLRIPSGVHRKTVEAFETSLKDRSARVSQRRGCHPRPCRSTFASRRLRRPARPQQLLRRRGYGQAWHLAATWSRAA